MCGIAGVLNLSLTEIPNLERRLEAMNQLLRHRGPDGEGLWQNDNGMVQLGHRRLSIIDLSKAAAQPMHFIPASSKRWAEGNHYTIIHNGEIYNYIEIRTHLEKEGYSFHTQSDTEVILAAYDFWNDECIEHFDGMFAFAVWDEKEQILFAARDRFGEKPFFYYYDSKSQTLYFASNIKALLALGLSDELNNSLLYNYMTLGHVKQIQWPDSTFFTKVFQLPPSHLLHYDIGKKKEPVVARYFDLDKESIIELDESKLDSMFKLKRLLIL